MSQHYTKRTLEASKWCKHCNAFTAHKVSGGQITRICIPCDNKAEAARLERLAHPEKPAAVQEALFA